jgi:hypothetical protein
MRALWALLVGFHVWLLAGHVSTGQLLEPERLFRWVIAAGLAAGLILLRRQGVAIFGRRAMVVWVLAGLLHVPAIANRLDSFDAPIAASLTELALVSVAVGSVCASSAGCPSPGPRLRAGQLSLSSSRLRPWRFRPAHCLISPPVRLRAPDLPRFHFSCQ